MIAADLIVEADLIKGSVDVLVHSDEAELSAEALDILDSLYEFSLSRDIYEYDSSE